MTARPAAVYLPSHPNRRDRDMAAVLDWAAANHLHVTTVATAPEQFPDLLRLYLAGDIAAILTPSMQMIPGIVAIAETTVDPERSATRRTGRVRPGTALRTGRTGR